VSFETNREAGTLMRPGLVPLRYPSMSASEARAPLREPDARDASIAARAWHDVERAAEAAGVRVEPLHVARDAVAVDDVIAAVWGSQPVGHELLTAMQHAGCALFGAWPAGASRSRSRGDLIGYVLGFVGNRGGLHVHSHMLAVVPDRQSRGVGFALKLAQRAWALESGIPEVRWTYDPMLLGNARFNLNRLGAVGTAYLPNFYGAMEDELNRGQRTDRFDLSWDTASGRVARAVERVASRARAPEPSTADAAIVLEASGDEPTAAPALTGRAPGSRAVVAIPKDHMALRRSDPTLAREWREAASRAFAHCFGAGLVAMAVTSDGRYLFETPDDPSDATEVGGV
jgi:predicted GNAT superfamily acetyltransferase